MKPNEPYTPDEIAFYAKEHKAGKSFSRIAFENGRDGGHVAKHVWRYLRERDYKL